MIPLLAVIQGVYLLVTGVLPILSISTFLKVTGQKTDLWLVKTVGIFLAVMGAALLVARIRGVVAPSASWMRWSNFS